MASVKRIIRQTAFQTLHLMDLRNDITPEQALSQVLSVNCPLDEQMTDSEVLLELFPDGSKHPKLAENALEQIKLLVEGTLNNQSVIDERISKNLSKWSINRIEKTYLQILRLATYELIIAKETDASVIMNEAIEITKTFNDQKSAKFVNAVLQGVWDDELSTKGEEESDI